MIEHACIKCSAKYSDGDEDAYYCPECNEVKKAIAIEVDAKYRGSSVKGKSDLQVYNEILKAKGRVNIRDLGITL